MEATNIAFDLKKRQEIALLREVGQLDLPPEEPALLRGNDAPHLPDFEGLVSSRFVFENGANVPGLLDQKAVFAAFADR